MILSVFKRLFRARRRQHPDALIATGLAYWDKRARDHGARAVLNLGHPENEADAITRRQVQEIMPHLIRCLVGDERTILDFGCGPGRFTAQLAEAIRGHAIGVDPIRTLIKLAPRHPDVSYLVCDGRCVPLADGRVDVAWVCLVLGGLSDAQLIEAASEIERVLRPGGLLFLVENTSAKANSSHWAFRSVASYQRLFPTAKLTHLHDYDDLRECISILAGRKASTPS